MVIKKHLSLSLSLSLLASALHPRHPARRNQHQRREHGNIRVELDGQGCRRGSRVHELEADVVLWMGRVEAVRLVDLGDFRIGVLGKGDVCALEAGELAPTSFVPILKGR